MVTQKEQLCLYTETAPAIYDGCGSRSCDAQSAQLLLLLAATAYYAIPSPICGRLTANTLCHIVISSPVQSHGAIVPL